MIFGSSAVNVYQLVSVAHDMRQNNGQWRLRKSEDGEMAREIEKV